MKKILCALPFLLAASVAAEPMVEDTDGEVALNEYRIISPNGAVTRRPCPYTCEMREVPRAQCKEWKSVDGQECYVQDLRLGVDDAMPQYAGNEKPKTLARLDQKAN